MTFDIIVSLLSIHEVILFPLKIYWLKDTGNSGENNHFQWKFTNFKLHSEHHLVHLQEDLRMKKKFSAFNKSINYKSFRELSATELLCDEIGLSSSLPSRIISLDNE